MSHTRMTTLTKLNKDDNSHSSGALFVCVEVLRPSQPSGSSQARSVYLTTRLLSRLSPLSG